MNRKVLIGVGAMVVAAVASGSSANAAGAGAGASAHLKAKTGSMAKTVALSPRGVRRTLQSRGYYNIKFTDRRLPVYKVRACKNGKRFSVRLNRWGEIRKRVRIGWCGGGQFQGPRAGLSFPQIRKKLNRRGYHTIRFTDRRLPGYSARACKKGKRFVLRLNRFGQIMDRERRGWCSARGSNRGGYYGPAVRYDGPGFSVRVRRHH